MTDVLADRPEQTTDEPTRESLRDLPPRLATEIDAHRRELTGYCYRMLGSSFDADDAVQETILRAYRAWERFEGRSSLRSWLYRIATNVCLDALDGRKRRATPMDMSPAPFAPVIESLGAQLPEQSWVGPALDDRVLAGGDPADVAAERDSVRLAFVAALQHLPPRQRVVLILRDVLRWHADEVADLLDGTVASVNSALQRARATLDQVGLTPEHAFDPMDEDTRRLLERYVDAFERYDIDAFVKLLHEDATQNMPPYPLWIRGPADIAAWMVGPGIGCKGSTLRFVAVNGQPAYAHWKPSGPGARLQPWAIHVLDLRDGRVARITSFLDTELFRHFGIPASPHDPSAPVDRLPPTG